MRFLIDAQLPPLLKRGLERAGHDAVHVFDARLVSASDREIWAYARRTGRVVLTKDQDFAALRQKATAGPAVVWLRMGNITNDVLEKRLATALPQIVSAIESGDVLIEVR